MTERADGWWSAGTGAGAGARVGAPRPTRPAGLPRRRLLAGLALALAGPPLLTVTLVAARATLSLASLLLIYLLAVVLVAVIGGTAPALIAAVGSFALANWFLTPPYHTFRIEQRDAVIALLVFVLVASMVSVAVELAARRRAAAARGRVEAELLSRIAAGPVAASVEGILDQIRDSFGMTSVALLEDGRDQPVAGVGPPVAAVTGHRPGRDGTAQDGTDANATAVDDGTGAGWASVVSVPAGGRFRLVAAGPPTFAEDRRLLRSLAAAAGRAVEGQRLAVQAGRAHELAEIDRLRAALLAAVGHDLRTPLAGIKAAVSSLRQDDVRWSPADTGEFLATIEESADRLDALVANLLDMSRLQAGVLSVEVRPVALDEVVARAVLDGPGGGVVVEVPDDLPLVAADPGLLERVLANLIANARYYAAGSGLIRVAATVDRDCGRAASRDPVHYHDADRELDGDADRHRDPGREPGRDWIRLSVVDSGPGIAPADRERVFEPFQRLDDRRTGVGLGLAIARGFTTAMGGTVEPTDTPGGGLTMVVSLPVAAP